MPNPNLVTDPNLLGILDDLKKHELIFHHPKFITKNIDYEKMIDDAFLEVGASGRLYSRESALEILKERQNTKYDWETKDFYCFQIAPDNFLLTYTLIEDKRITRRSTIWRKTKEGWKVLFHQGTIVQAEVIENKLQ